MRIPVPKHTLVALTLVGALLTTVVAGGLMVPSLLPGDDSGANDATNAVGASADAPTPNANFTPAVQTASGGGYEEGEHEGEEHEEHQEHEGEWDD